MVEITPSTADKAVVFKVSEGITPPGLAKVTSEFMVTPGVDDMVGSGDNDDIGVAAGVLNTTGASGKGINNGPDDNDDVGVAAGVLNTTGASGKGINNGPDDNDDMGVAAGVLNTAGACGKGINNGVPPEPRSSGSVVLAGVPRKRINNGVSPEPRSSEPSGSVAVGVLAGVSRKRINNGVSPEPMSPEPPGSTLMKKIGIPLLTILLVALENTIRVVEIIGVLLLIADCSLFSVML